MAERSVPRVRTQRAVAGLLVPAATAALLVVALRSPVPGGGTGLAAVTAAVIACWALAAVVCAWSPRRASGWTAAAAALLAAATLAAGRLAASSAGSASGAGHTAARTVATVGVPLVIAAALHLVLAFPDGRLAGRPRQVTAAVAYLIAAVAGLGLAVAGRPFPVAAAAAGASVAGLAALPSLRLRYLRAAGHDREALQWAGLGAVTAADIALVAVVLHLLVAWPGAAGLVAEGATVAIPLATMAAITPALGRQASRLFVYVLSAAGFSVVVAVIYLIVILGFGQAPDSSADREVLGLSMLAAAIAAIGYLPARDRLAAAATRFVYGARQAPDEVLRTFGSRLTRNVTMDELLLQLAESLRKTMSLTSAEVYTGSSDVLERTVSVPDSGPRSLVLTSREREVVSRAGVSGNAWTAIWLPALLDGRLRAQLRVAPVSHGGELLGLIVVERPADADSFTEDDDRVLTELARQTGLAFHNVQLDAALHTTLDELRKQAEELRASRARIVASGDAERRRVERNLHDGAQQHLVALAINLRLAKDIVADDPDGTAQILDQLATDVQDTIKELRELAHGIYPPLLADQGLGEALRAAAGRSPLAVAVSVADDVGRYPAELEAAIYFCCLEALQNAGKHAPGATVQLGVWTEAGGLNFAVSDDGPGFDPAQARGGHGFVNMADRLGAIGGTVRWDSIPGRGATISGSIPLP
ncbi:MAG TPA: GAF domain-containing sensor histidine kinase [Streptosporangiaceae bacterium]